MKHIFFLLVLTSLFTNLQAQETTTQNARPKVGVVLGGGGDLTAMYNVLYEQFTGFYSITHGTGLKYSYKSALGPVSLTGQWESFTSKFNVYFSIGYTF